MKKVTLGQFTLSIDPRTRMLNIQDGSSVISMTRDQVIGLKKLREGGNSNGVYTSTVSPRNRFSIAPTGAITVECNDEYHRDYMTINRLLYKGILSFVETHKGAIAWDRDFRRK